MAVHSQSRPNPTLPVCTLVTLSLAIINACSGRAQPPDGCAQIDSWAALDYESGGHEFESLRARQLNQKLRVVLLIGPGAIRLVRVHN